jgi:hypothetical protein
MRPSQRCTSQIPLSRLCVCKRNPPVVARQRFDARQRLNKDAPATKNTRYSRRIVGRSIFMRSVGLCIPLWFLGNNSVKTFPRQRRIFAGVVFCAVHVVSKDSRRLVLPRTSCLYLTPSFLIASQMGNIFCISCWSRKLITLFTIFSHFNPVHTTSCFSNTDFDVILRSTSRPTKLFLVLKFSSPNFRMHFSFPPCVLRVPPTLSSLCLRFFQNHYIKYLFFVLHLFFKCWTNENNHCLQLGTCSMYPQSDQLQKFLSWSFSPILLHFVSLLQKIAFGRII